MPAIVATLYHFADLPDCDRLRDSLFELGTAANIKGTLLLAREGINGTIAGDRQGIDRVIGWLRADDRLTGLRVLESTAPEPPFQRFKVKLKREIVTLGVANLAPQRRTGHHVSPQDWNALLRDPEVITIDTRNGFEVAAGSFSGAIDPQTTAFRDLPDAIAQTLDPQVHRKIAMFCTGGIRCEKASAYLLDRGFEAVYQLDGGILNYLAQIPPEESLWHGECFVFDDRVSVVHGLKPGSSALCQACGRHLALVKPSHSRDRPCPHCADRSPAPAAPGKPGGPAPPP